VAKCVWVNAVHVDMCPASCLQIGCHRGFALDFSAAFRAAAAAPAAVFCTLCRPFMQQLLHAALEHLGSALSTAFAGLPNAGSAAAAAAGTAAAGTASGCPVEALGQYFMDLVYLDAVLSKAGEE
jgi:hypothetical protein